jgi:hypothetical protein
VFFDEVTLGVWCCLSFCFIHCCRWMRWRPLEAAALTAGG